MSFTRIINNIRYLEMAHDNNFKLLSLEDNVYFTLRDIFNNISGVEYCTEACNYCSKITNNVYYSDRDESFQYTNVLHDYNFVCELNHWLKSIHPSDFVFEPFDDNANSEEKKWYYDKTNLIMFNVWWLQFENLRHQIKTRMKKLKIKTVSMLRVMGTLNSLTI